MSGDGSYSQSWGDGEYTFRLRIGELRALEDKRNSGSFEIYRRLADGSWRVDDITETLRLGLIGGGMNAALALGMVAKYVTPTNYLLNMMTARSVIMAALFGDPDDLVGKIAAGIAGTAAQSQNEGAPGFRPSSEQEPQWAGPLRPSTDVHSGNSPPLSTVGNDATVLTMNGRPL